MKLTINQIKQSEDSIAAAIKERKISPSLKMYLMMMVDPVDVILGKAEKIRIDLIKQMGTEVDGGISVAEEDLPKFSAELSKLYDVEVEVPMFKCSQEDLINAENLSVLDMKILLSFSDLFNEEEIAEDKNETK